MNFLPVSVFVIDDKPHFAVHVWRALSGALEFGAPDELQRDVFRARSHVPEATTLPEESAAVDDVQRFDWERRDERFHVSWHDARGGVEALRRRLRRAVVDESAVALIDMRLGDRELWLKYYVCLEGFVAAERLFLFSSYETRATVRERPLEVYSKTPESFDWLRERLDVRSINAEVQEWAADELHVLVTGAGFELAGDRSRTGLPRTWQILDAMGCALAPLALRGGDEPVRFERAVGSRFPLLNDVHTRSCGGLEAAVESGDLDGYWEAILRWVGQHHEGGAATELILREAFRRAIAQYDIGHMAHSLLAAMLPWDAWLSTNYTGFADRAIERVADAEMAWNSIRTKEEAGILLRVSSLPADSLPKRIFVKLHGDVSSVRSMAVATSDKTVKEPRLTVEPSLELMYSATTEWIRKTMRSRRAVHWHVVGHSLRDRVLTEKMRDLFDGPVTHHVTIVAPDAEEIQNRLVAGLTEPSSSSRTTSRVPDFTLHSMYAEIYMRCLCTVVGPKADESAAVRPAWRSRVPSRSGGQKY